MSGRIFQAPIVGTAVRLVIGVAALLALPMAGVAAAQDRPGPAAEFAAGWAGFVDDGIGTESLVGGAVRLYLHARLSVGPEAVYVHAEHHSHLTVTGNVTWDVRASTNGRPPSITPFLVVGGGVFQTRDTFSGTTSTSSEAAFTGGGGVRARVGDRVTVGVDTRLGWGVDLRLNGLVGVLLWR